VTDWPPWPLFPRETATQKTRIAENACNSHDPEKVSLAFTEDNRWRNRADFSLAARLEFWDAICASARRQAG